MTIESTLSLHFEDDDDDDDNCGGREDDKLNQRLVRDGSRQALRTPVLSESTMMWSHSSSIMATVKDSSTIEMMEMTANNHSSNHNAKVSPITSNKPKLREPILSIDPNTQQYHNHNQNHHHHHHHHNHADDASLMSSATMQPTQLFREPEIDSSSSDEDDKKVNTNNMNSTRITTNYNNSSINTTNTITSPPKDIISHVNQYQSNKKINTSGSMSTNDTSSSSTTSWHIQSSSSEYIVDDDEDSVPETPPDQYNVRKYPPPPPFNLPPTIQATIRIDEDTIITELKKEMSQGIDEMIEGSNNNTKDDNTSPVNSLDAMEFIQPNHNSSSTSSSKSSSKDHNDGGGDDKERYYSFEELNQLKRKKSSSSIDQQSNNQPRNDNKTQDDSFDDVMEGETFIEKKQKSGDSGDGFISTKKGSGGGKKGIQRSSESTTPSSSTSGQIGKSPKKKLATIQTTIIKGLDLDEVETASQSRRSPSPPRVSNRKNIFKSISKQKEEEQEEEEKEKEIKRKEKEKQEKKKQKELEKEKERDRKQKEKEKEKEKKRKEKERKKKLKEMEEEEEEDDEEEEESNTEEEEEEDDDDEDEIIQTPIKSKTKIKSSSSSSSSTSSKKKKQDESETDSTDESDTGKRTRVVISGSKRSSLKKSHSKLKKEKEEEEEEEETEEEEQTFEHTERTVTTLRRENSKLIRSPLGIRKSTWTSAPSDESQKSSQSTSQKSSSSTPSKSSHSREKSSSSTPTQRSTKIESTLFKGYNFILTGIPEIGNPEMNTSTLILQYGGKILPVHDFFKAFSCRTKANTSSYFLLACDQQKTYKYLSSVIHGIPCVNNTWILDSIDQREIIDYRPYRLPSGFCISTNENVLLKHGSKPFLTNTRIEIFAETVFTEEWTSILKSLGAKVVKRIISVSDRVDIVLTDGKKISEVLLKYTNTMKIPVVTTDWVIQSILEQTKLPFTSNSSFLFQKSDNDDEDDDD